MGSTTTSTMAMKARRYAHHHFLRCVLRRWPNVGRRFGARPGEPVSDMLLVASTWARSDCLLSMMSSPLGLKQLQRGDPIEKGEARPACSVLPERRDNKGRNARGKERQRYKRKANECEEKPNLRSWTPPRHEGAIQATVASSETRTGDETRERAADLRRSCQVPKQPCSGVLPLVRRRAKPLGGCAQGQGLADM